MIMQVRNNKDKNIIDVELYVKSDLNNKYLECIVSIPIRVYDNERERLTFSDLYTDFVEKTIEIDEKLREYILTNYKYTDIDSSIKTVRKYLQEYAKSFNFTYIED